MTNLLLTLKNKHKRFQLIGNFHELFESTVLLSKTELRLPFQGRMIKFSINYPDSISVNSISCPSISPRLATCPLVQFFYRGNKSG